MDEANEVETAGETNETPDTPAETETAGDAEAPPEA